MRILPPIAVLAGTIALVLAGGHAFAGLGRGTTRRVPVSDRAPAAAASIPGMRLWDGPRIFQEAPMLAERSLPAIAERLPDRPLVIVPPQQEGPYGGTWTRFPTSLGESLRVEAEWYLNATTLVRWRADGSGVEPDVAEAVEVGTDARSVTFRLRRGLRWSDGAPFTSADVRFWWDHLANDLSVNQNPATRLDGAVLETPDEWTVRFILPRPDSLLLQRFASDIWASDMVSSPRHYLQPFHRSGGATMESLDEGARAAGFPGWADRFRNRWSWRNPECPRLWAWVMKVPPPATTVVMERNPWYGKVDPSGRQLPYIDRIAFSLTDAESVALKLMRGDSPMQERHLRPKDYPLLMAHQPHGRYRVRHWLGAGMICLALNRGHRDPVLRALFDDGRLAQAISLGIDRSELINLFTHGVGTPMQAVPAPASPFHDAVLAGRDTASDPAQAATLLDALGCARGQDGLRTLPDGRPLRLQVDVYNPDLVEVGQVLTQQLGRIGIGLDVRLSARELFYTRKDNAEHDALLDGGCGGNEMLPLLDPRATIPGQGESSWAGLYGHFVRSDGVRGLPLPPDLRQTLEDWAAITGTSDQEEQRQRFRAILERQAAHRAVIGLYTLQAPFLVVRDDLRNVPQAAVSGWSFRHLGASAPECFALDPLRSR